jgi:pimeloyl-ACP methyl ester carboxylesterase
LPDGRVITGVEVGDPAGVPVLYFHGTPGSAVEAVHLAAHAHAHGVRVVALDRPGIGGSTQARHRTVRSWAADASDVATELGLDRPGVLGYSGGGPYALACALGSGRFGPVAVVAGAPPVESRADMAAMDPTDRGLTLLGRRAPRLGGLIVGVAGRWVRQFPRATLRIWMTGLSAVDRAVLRNAGGPGRSTMVDLGYVLASSGRGVVDDERALADPWGFGPSEVVAPVRWWHGDDDLVVPLDHARPFIDRLPDVDLTVVPGAGHLLLDRIAPLMFEVVVAGR